MTYHNTTGQSDSELERRQQQAETQEARVLAFFREHPSGEFTPEDVRARVLPNAPLTSARRAITNLTNAQLLEKTERQVKGSFGHAVNCWRLKPLAPVGESLPLFDERKSA